MNYADIYSRSIDELVQGQPLIREIQAATTIKQLRNVISHFATATNTTKADDMLKEKPQKSIKPKIAVLTGVLGMILGMLLIYAIKVVPMTEASTVEANNKKN